MATPKEESLCTEEGGNGPPNGAMTVLAFRGHDDGHDYHDCIQGRKSWTVQEEICGKSASRYLNAIHRSLLPSKHFAVCESMSNITSYPLCECSMSCTPGVRYASRYRVAPFHCKELHFSSATLWAVNVRVLVMSWRPQDSYLLADANSSISLECQLELEIY